MIVTRFRLLGSAAGAAVAVIGCYMVSLNVAAERNELARVERQIARAKSDIRYLQTELGTRSRLSELERWNTDVLALQAPSVGQYAQDQVQLASLAGPRGAPLPSVPLPPGTSMPVADARVVQAAYQPAAPAPAPAPRAAAPRVARVVVPEPVAPAPMIRQATYVKPVGDAIAPRAASLLDGALLGEIERRASLETARTAERSAKSATAKPPTAKLSTAKPAAKADKAAAAAAKPAGGPSTRSSAKSAQ